MADAMDSPVPIHERVKTAIAYKIGADRPDEAIKIIESIKRDNAGRWQAEAFGWLAVALAPRDRARAFALIDRALDLITDDSIAVEDSTGYEMVAAAARRRLRTANRLSRHGERRHASDRCVQPANWSDVSFKKIQYVSLAAIGLATPRPRHGPRRTQADEANCKSVGHQPRRVCQRPRALADRRRPWPISRTVRRYSKPSWPRSTKSTRPICCSRASSTRQSSWQRHPSGVIR